MTAIPQTVDFKTTARSVTIRETRSTFETTDAYWGYILRSTEPPSVILAALQAAASILGALFLAATIGLWVFGSGSLEPVLMAMKLGASVVMVGLGVLLLWFASRGDRIEFQIDTSLGEVREVVRNRAGRPTLAARYGFDGLTDVVIEPVSVHRPNGDCWLLLTDADHAQTLTVVRGPQAALAPLAERIGRDILAGSVKTARFEAVHPFELRHQTEAA